MDGLYRAMGEPGRDDTRPQYCDACFSGDYPIRLTDHEGGADGGQLSFLTEIVGGRR
jgi:amidophosphoribosyltransferase